MPERFYKVNRDHLAMAYSHYMKERAERWQAQWELPEELRKRDQEMRDAVEQRRSEAVAWMLEVHDRRREEERQRMHDLILRCGKCGLFKSSCLCRRF